MGHVAAPRLQNREPDQAREVEAWAARRLGNGPREAEIRSAELPAS